jgi:hypothetical protein
LLNARLESTMSIGKLRADHSAARVFEQLPRNVDTFLRIGEDLAETIAAISAREKCDLLQKRKRE